MELWVAYRRHWLWPTFLFSFMIYIMFVWPGSVRSQVENDITELISSVLVAQGLNEVKVSVIGRDVILSGDMSPSDSQALVNRVSQLSDYRGLVAPRVVTWLNTAGDLTGSGSGATK